MTRPTPSHLPTSIVVACSSEGKAVWMENLRGWSMAVVKRQGNAPQLLIQENGLVIAPGRGTPGTSARTPPILMSLRWTFISRQGDNQV